MISYEELKNIRENEKKNKINKYNIRVANSTCAILAGVKPILFELENFKREEVNIIKTGCMGYCYCEPTVEIEFPTSERLMLGNVDKKTILKIMELLENNADYKLFLETLKCNEVQKRKLEHRVVLDKCGVIDPLNILSSVEHGRYEALYKAITSYKPKDIIEIIKKSKLRGRGGAGYYTGKKWEIISANGVSPKYVVCNADEGDPGAFMDRVILESDPHSVLEAMAICGYAIGSSKGYVYIRAEYPLAVESLNVALFQAKEIGILGKNIFGTNFDFDIEIKYGAGAFVCGEETALIRSMEGKRGEPGSKPPYPSERGYLGFPTNVNNVETFSNVRKIILNGYEWFNSIGTEKSSGTKVFSLVGKIASPSVVEVPIGTTLREIIYDVGNGIKNNKKFKSVQTGGPTGGTLSEADLDIPIDYETLASAGSMMGSGGMIVLDEDNCMVDIAKFYLGFSKSESCGKCTPCRIGVSRLYELVDKISKGEATLETLNLISELSVTVKRAALCGLGKTAPNNVISSLSKFKEEYLEHINENYCRAKVCRDLITYAIQEKSCVRCGACYKKCPVKAISGDKKIGYTIDQSKCIKCGECFRNCAFKAIKAGGKNEKN